MLVTFKLYLLHAFRHIRALSCRVSWQCRLAQERHTVYCRYSFFPDEAEILLSPNARFIVANEATLEVNAAAAACRRHRCCWLLLFDHVQADGYYYVDLIEKRGEGVVF
jgi:hypothetical protein